MPGLALSAHGPPARETLWAAIDDAKGDDPLAPVTVAAASVYAGLSLRRLLAARPPGRDMGCPGLVNVRFLPLARVAELLGAPALAAEGRRPLTAPLRAAAIRAALAAEPGGLRPVAQHAATERSLMRTFRELRLVPDAELALLGGRSRRAGDVVALYRSFRGHTAAFYDVEDLLEAAARAVGDGTPALDDVGTVVVHLPGDLTPPEVALLDALAATRRTRIVIGLTGDPDVDEPASELADRLSPALASDPAPQLPLAAVPTGQVVVSAPEPDDEIAEVVRGICRRVEAGTPLHRMAVLYRSAEPYVRIIHEQLAAAGIAASGPGARTLADSVAGRALLGALSLPERHFRRDDVMAWLASAPIVEPDRPGRAPASRWDALSRLANVVGGSEQWDERLERLAARLEIDAAAREAAGEDARVARLRDDVDHLSRLRSFVTGLAAALEPPPDPTWSALARWAVDLFSRVLGSERRLASWPEAEAMGYRQVRERVAGLAGVAEIDERVDVAIFRRAVEAELDVPATPIGRFGTGVFVGSLGQAAGTEFDTIFVVGMNEGSFPPRPRDDALVPDRERTGTHLAPRANRSVQERRDYLGALFAAPERVLSFSRADSRGQRKLRPSRWLLETATARHGATVYADDLDRIETSAWLRVIESFEAAVTRADPPASPSEFDLSSLVAWRESRDQGAVARHPLAADDPTLRAGFAAHAGRAGRRLSPYDGLVGPLGDLAPSPERPVSPTSLEDWATCPLRYLLGRVLGLEVLPRPEALTEIEPREQGSLVHAVLARFIESVPPRRDPSEPWSTEERAGLRAIAEQCCDEVEAAGLTGKPLLWRLAKRRILRDLDAALDADEIYRSELGVVPLAVEVPFGLDDDGPPAVPVDLGDGVRVAFRGRIDRVDRAPDDSHLSVVDYKTGSHDDPAVIAEDPVVRGTRLQLAVYALAARAAYGDVPVHAEYWFTRHEGRYPSAGFELDDHNLRRVHEVLRIAVESVRAGLFPARPGKESYFGGYDNCRRCDFDRLCGVDRAAHWERKRSDPRIHEYVHLAEADTDAETRS